jgi:transcription elongation GreA/GreB family factor
VKLVRPGHVGGDIAETPQYDAKNEHMLLEHRIATLEQRLRNPRVVSKKDIEGRRVRRLQR